MTSYMLFAGLGTLIYVAVALAQAATAGFGDAHIAFKPCAAACQEWRETIAGEEQPGGDPHTAHRPDQYMGQP